LTSKYYTSHFLGSMFWEGGLLVFGESFFTSASAATRGKSAFARLVISANARALRVDILPPNLRARRDRTCSWTRSYLSRKIAGLVSCRTPCESPRQLKLLESFVHFCVFFDHKTAIAPHQGEIPLVGLEPGCSAEAYAKLPA
jgi:hypothetical protein